MDASITHPVVEDYGEDTTNCGLGPAYQHRPFQVLVLDGGGFRGLFTAVVVAEWEKKLGRPIASHFDLIVGTSTGGIIALGLAAGMRAAELVDFYVKDGATIFPRRWSPQRLWSGLKHYAFSKYRAAPIEEALRKRLPKVTMGELRTPVVVTGFNLEAGRHWFFKTPHYDGDNLLDAQRPLWEVARATSAAPTFFPAFRTSANELFVDGGLVANNPSLIGYFEVLLNFEQHAGAMKILNIGTEGGECSLPKWRLRWGGLLPWANQAPDALMLAQAVSTESLMERVLGPDRWLRVKPEHGRGFAPLDVYDPEVYQGLGATQAARQFAVANRLFFSHSARHALVGKSFK